MVKWTENEMGRERANLHSGRNGRTDDDVGATGNSVNC